jgi:hypothetical protein
LSPNAFFRAAKVGSPVCGEQTCFAGHETSPILRRDTLKVAGFSLQKGVSN